jgi:hypothetical protein
MSQPRLDTNDDTAATPIAQIARRQESPSAIAVPAPVLRVSAQRRSREGDSSATSVRGVRGGSERDMVQLTQSDGNAPRSIDQTYDEQLERIISGAVSELAAFEADIIGVVRFQVRRRLTDSRTADARRLRANERQYIHVFPEVISTGNVNLIGDIVDPNMYETWATKGKQHAAMTSAEMNKAQLNAQAKKHVAIQQDLAMSIVEFATEYLELYLVFNDSIASLEDDPLLSTHIRIMATEYPQLVHLRETAVSLFSEWVYAWGAAAEYSSLTQAAAVSARFLHPDGDGGEDDDDDDSEQSSQDSE